MARTRNQTTAQATTTVTVDAIDQLTAKLSETGTSFVRDAWLNKAPDNYGVVELSEESKQLWADGHLLDSAYRVIVTLYVKGDDDTIPSQVQAKLEELESAGKLDLTYTVSRGFDYDIGKVRWAWSVFMYGPLTWTEEVPVQSGGGS